MTRYRWIDETHSPPAQIVACGVCFVFVLWLASRAFRRRAAVGRAEMTHLFVVSTFALE